MKQPKKLTREQKKLVKAAGYIPENWMLQSKASDHIVIVSKMSSTTRKIEI